MKKLPVSQVDTVFANGSYPIEFLLFYQNKLDTQKISAALKKTSSAFCPMFGHYKSGIIYFDEYSEKDCFAEQVFDQEFDIAAANDQIFEQHFRINPIEMKKLFFLTVVQYKNGTVLIPKLNHLAGDGYSYFYFLTVLAELSRDTHVPLKKNVIRALFKPHHRRTILREFSFDGIERPPIQPEQNLTIKFEQFSRQSVKDAINKIASENDRLVSTNDYLSALIIKKSVVIQDEFFGEEFQLTIPIDVRRYIKEYGKKFFGNGIMFHTVNFRTGDIKNFSTESLAIKIRESMPKVTKEVFLEFLIYLEELVKGGQTEKLRPYDPERGCLITNLSKLPASNLNFGSGNPAFIFPLTIEKNSAVILANAENFILRLAY